MIGKRILFTSALAAATAVSVASATSDTLFRSAMGQLNAMRTIYAAQYAPAAHKAAKYGYDLQSEFVKAAGELRSAPLTFMGVRETFKRFIYAMKDYHVGILFYSTEEATLPISVQGVGDRYFLVGIDRAKLPVTAFPFQIGDELISFDGVPTAQAVAAVQAEIPEVVPGTDRARAEQRLTARNASRGLKVPRGPVALEIKRGADGPTVRTQLIWEYKEEKIAPRPDALLSIAGVESGSALLNPRMELPFGERAESPAAGPSFQIGARQTFTPDLGPKVWENAPDAEFYAYIYRAADRRLIGYVRVPSYTPSDATKAIAEFAAIIQRFEATTDAMVIDEVNNPGGSVFYLYAMASMLSDQPLKTPRHRMSITQADVADALETIEKLKNVKNDEEARKALPAEDMSGFPASYQFAQFTLNYARFIVSEWNAGRRLTTPYWIGGVDQINPSPTHYTKPILVLVNQLDFSGGDFFPAILQDNRRATIMGQRTSGAGGYVRAVTIPNDLGIMKFSVTASIAERVDGSPIESIGVTPDLPYEMTVEDLQTNFRPYAEAVRAAVLTLIK